MSFKNFLATDHTDVGPKTVATGMAVFAVILLLMGFDVVEDYRSGTELSHLMTEGMIMVVAVFGLATLLIQFRSLQHRAKRLTVDLEAARREAERFREEAREALLGLGEAIDNQFTRWGLSPAEREVGLLLLKGLSHRDIAQVRSTSETTIRQQALALYRKSDLRSRAELSAFFLEDLLLPATQR
jgi:DNA-binding CsgD family transcriptional regulator